MTSSRKDVRDFVFRGLLFESETEGFRKAGIDVGIDTRRSEEQLLLEALAPFGIKRRNDALEMARLYAVVHAFENEVRSLIRDTLDEKVGTDWWDGERFGDNWDGSYGVNRHDAALIQFFFL